MVAALRLAVVSLAIVATAFVNTALANTRAAKRMFRKAQTHYKLGRFQDALDAYSKAYELKPLAPFLFNIGQCHMELDQYDKAIFFFEGFLREAPQSRNRALAEERLAEARAALERIKNERQQLEEERLRQEKQQQLALEQQRAEQQRRLVEQRQPDEHQRTLREAAARVVGETPAALRAPADGDAAAVAESGSPFYSQWWFWAIVGGAAVAAGGTAALIATSGSRRTVLPAGEMGTIDGR
jgi:tetratricopeptide (TPR) repeat protein